jgi:hypothetical protein
MLWMWIASEDRGYFEWSVDESIQALVTSRRGGVSQPPWQSLNLSFNVADVEEAVMENRRRVAALFESSPASMVWAEQVHGSDVAVVDESDRGLGALSPDTAISGCDGLLTRSSGVLLSLVFADCVPIFLSEPRSGWVGVVHAGWRGTAARIAARAVSQLEREGVPANRIWAAIGPSIGSCCYEVDQPVIDRIESSLASVDGGPVWVAGKDNQHYQLDLWEANRRMLQAAGLDGQRIEILGLCTACHSEDFFSHRRDLRQSGRIGAFIWRR